MSMLLIVDMKEAGMSFAPKELRYIKLGPSGAWARAAIRDGTLPFGFREAPHEACMAGDWEGVRTALAAAGRSQAAITQDLREIRAFYELGPDALWVTFCDGRLYWCFAEAGVDDAADDQGGTLPSRVRKVMGGWRNETLDGQPLGSGAIGSSITSVSGYRRTICKIAAEEQLLRLIRGELNPLQADLARINEDLRNLVVRMVRQLDWQDF
jgi:hypothetical protein